MKQEIIEKVLELSEKKRILEGKLDLIVRLNPNEGQLFFQDSFGSKTVFDGIDKEENREILTRIAEFVAKKLDAVNKELESL